MGTSYHLQISLKHFGPPEDVKGGEVEVFHVGLVVNGERVPPLKRVARSDLLRSEVELGCGSYEDYKVKSWPVTERVPYAMERRDVRVAWRRLVRAYDDKINA